MLNLLPLALLLFSFPASPAPPKPAPARTYLVNLAVPGNTRSMDGIRLETGSPETLTDGDPATIWRKLPFRREFVILTRFSEPTLVEWVWIRAEEPSTSAPRSIQVLAGDEPAGTFRNLSYDEHGIALLRIPPKKVRELEVRIFASYGPSPGIRDYALFGEKKKTLPPDRVAKGAEIPGGRIHMLLVDLGKPVTLARIVIKHAGVRENPAWNTRVFRVTGSLDKKGPYTPLFDWVRGNTEKVTEHGFPPRKVRFLRLEIPQAEQEGNGAARIYALEAYDREGKNAALVSKGARAWATSTTNRRELPRFAIDGRDDTKWCGRVETIRPLPGTAPDRFLLLPGRIGSLPLVTPLQ